MRRVWETKVAGFELILDQHGAGGKRFNVTYGAQVKRQLTYNDAAHEIGLCLFHGLTCEAKMDPPHMRLPKLNRGDAQ